MSISCSYILYIHADQIRYLSALTLEELDQVFSVPTRKHASYQIKNAIWHFRVWVLRQKLEPLPDFYKDAEHLGQ